MAIATKSPAPRRRFCLIAAAALLSAALGTPSSGAAEAAVLSGTTPPLHALATPATFAGTIPCADCPGIRVTLTLLDDGTYRRRDVYLEGPDGEDLAVFETGRWRLEEGRRVALTSEGRRTGALAVVTSDELRFLGADDLPIEADLPFELHRLPEVDPLDDALREAAEPTLCFGNEPFWSLDFATPGEARLTFPDEPPVVYRGRETRYEPLRERVWRGAPDSGGGDLVAFLADGACSDGMSDVTHPRSARVSLPDGRFLVGCCRVPAGQHSARGR